MDYRKCAQEIYELVGKRENLASAAHCATRLRLVTNDNSKVDMKKLEDVDGVRGVSVPTVSCRSSSEPAPSTRCMKNSLTSAA